MFRRSNLLSTIMLLVATGLLAQCQRSAPAVSTSVSPAGEGATAADLSDALLLYAAGKERLSDAGFRKISAFYGLKLASVDLDSHPLTDALLRDEAGVYYPAVAIDAKTLQTALDSAEIQVLQDAVNTGGINVLISALQYEKSSAVHDLTNGAIRGAARPLDRHRDYLVASTQPEITRELSGLTITYDAEQLDYALDIAPDTSDVQVLVRATDDQGKQYPIFARYHKGAGSIFVVSNHIDRSIKDNLLRWNYAAKRSGAGFSQQWFAQVLPMMMFVRFAAGDEAWHRDRDYANFTLDDPALQQSQFDYAAILEQAIKHDFHLTVALRPVTYTRSEPAVIDLFLAYPDRLSLVQHGNNHDGYEFYKYTAASDDKYPARPLEEQEMDIVEGRTRMEAHARRTGIPYAPVMIFPHNISPIDTLALLKRYNFQATINSMDYPLDAKRTQTQNSFMYPAELAYNDFAVISRSAPGNDPYPFTLFIDRPVLIYTHPDLFEKNGIGALNQLADTINELPGEAVWRSIDYIIKHLYLEKRNDDGSIDVMFFGNNLVITNETGTQQTYHVKRRETLNAPIHSISIDGDPVEHTIDGDTLQIDLAIAPQSSREIRIVYGAPDKDFSVSRSDIAIESLAAGTISALIHNQGPVAGPVSVEFFNGHPELGGVSLGIATLRIEPGGFSPARIADATVTGDNVCVHVDPYNIVLESDETNNIACAR